MTRAADVWPGMLIDFGSATCPVLKIEQVDPAHVRIHIATTNGDGWLTLPNDAPVPIVEETP